MYLDDSYSDISYKVSILHYIFMKFIEYICDLYKHLLMLGQREKYIANVCKCYIVQCLSSSKFIYINMFFYLLLLQFGK